MKLDSTNIPLEERKLLSQAFEAFNSSIEKLRSYQMKLEKQIQELKDEVQFKNQELTNILQSLSNGLIVTDLEGRIFTFNRAASALTGIHPDQAKGQRINDLLHHDLLPETLDDASLQKLDEQDSVKFKFNKGGEEVVFEANLNLMESEEAERQGVILNLSDITLLDRLKEEAERKRRLAERTGPLWSVPMR